jgi:hypothetical protein
VILSRLSYALETEGLEFVGSFKVGVACSLWLLRNGVKRRKSLKKGGIGSDWLFNLVLFFMDMGYIVRGENI